MNKALTPNPKFRYQPKHVDEIVVRKFNFDFPDDLDPKWAKDSIVRSHMFNGFSLTMPYLEPYLIKSTNKALSEIHDERMREDIRGFCGQEARHYQCHRRLNELIKKNGYPELAEVEERMKQSYAKLEQRSLETQLAYNAGFETMAEGMTRWVISKRVSLWGGNCPWISSFWVMHMVEEMEHKTVAYDTYMAYSGRYLPRAFGVLHGSLHVLTYGLIAMRKALIKDGVWGTPKTTLQVVKELGSLIRHLGPFILRAMLPGHNPRIDQDPQWQKDWVEGHKKLAPDAPIPLLDTSHPDIPVPFAEA